VSLTFFSPRLTLAIGLSIASCAAAAQTFDAVRLNAAPPGKDGGYAGAAVIGGTQYLGSDERRNFAVPVVEYQWANGWFAGTTNGVGYNFSKNPRMQYGARLTFDLGREESRSTALSGMGDIKAAGEVGGFFNYGFAPNWLLTSSVRTGSAIDKKGTLLDLGLGYSTKLSDRWRLSTSAGLTWANDEYMQSYFGVTPAQSQSSGYSVYSPGAALRDGRVSLALSYQASPRISVTAAVSSSTLSDEAKRSRFVKQSATVSGVVALTYAF
jgi:outer membrane scaffolding protein for murein synthesis (MipA/OmpV family)